MMSKSEKANIFQSALIKTGSSNISSKIRLAELDILGNGSWNNEISDFVPQLLIGMREWPEDSGLRITDLTGDVAQTLDFGIENASTVYEIERIHLPGTALEHYRAVHRAPGGREIEDVPADGNCFFASVLNVLGEAGRRRLGIPVADNATQIARLREMMANHLVENHTHYAPFLADVSPEVAPEPDLIDWHPEKPDHFGLRIKAMPWYTNVLGHLSMKQMDLIDQIERIAFSKESCREIDSWVRPLLKPIGSAERDEIQAVSLVNFLKIADAAHDTYQIWPAETAGRVFQTLAVLAYQTVPTERDAVMAAYQEIGNAYDRSPLFQHFVNERPDHLESDIREFLTNRDAQAELMRVLELADRYGDVALPLIAARLHERLGPL